MSNTPPGFSGAGGSGYNSGFLGFGSSVGQFDTPTIDQSKVDQNVATAGQNEGQQQQVLNEEQQMAQGKGPSAATDLLNAQTAKTNAAVSEQASSSSGSEGALARRQAQMQTGEALQNLGGTAAAARSAEQIGAMGAAGSMATSMRGQDIDTAGMEGGLATSQAQLQGQTQSLNEQAQEANIKNQSAGLSGLAGMAAGAAMFLDGEMGGDPMPGGPGARVGTTDFKEPGGGNRSHWTFREQKNFVAAVNRRTGKPQAVVMRDLTPAEMHELLNPNHGAGPINSPQRAHSQMHADGDLGNVLGAIGTAAGSAVAKNVADQYTKPQEGQNVADGDFTSDQRFAQVVRRAHPALYRASMADGEMGGQPAMQSEYAEAFPEQAGKYEAGRTSTTSGQREKGFQADLAREETSDPDRAAFMRSEGREHFMRGDDTGLRAQPKAKPTPAPAGTNSGQVQGGAPGRGGNAIAGALLGFSDPKSVTKLAAARLQQAPAAQPQTPAVQAPKSDDVRQDITGRTLADADLVRHEYEKRFGDGDLRDPLANFRSPPKPLPARDEIADEAPEYYDHPEPGLAKEQAKRFPAKSQPAPIRMPTVDAYQNQRTFEMPEEDIVSGAGQTRDRVIQEDHRTREGNDERREEGFKELHRLTRRPALVSDGELATRDPSTPTDDPGPAKPKGDRQTVDAVPGRRGRDRYGRRVADGDYRASFDRDVRNARAELDAQEHPIDIDAVVPSVDDPYGWPEPEHVERTPNPRPGGRDLELRTGGRDNPVDLDDEAAVARAEEELAGDRRVRETAREMEAMNPYEDRPRRGGRPAIAALFPATRARSPKQNAGPVDFMSALHESNERFDRRPLGESVREFERDQAERSGRQQALNRAGADLVPNEFEEIAEEAEGPNASEAAFEEVHRRSKLRHEVHNLLEEWRRERESKKHRVHDGELGSKKGGALASVMKKTRRRRAA